uniref:DDIT3 protein n=1 Tax=Pavo cristatus TaxID=9049 RepID=A0A8C9FUE3_PAVCR
MAAAGEPPSDELPAWFLELQELQELLMAAEPLEPPTPGGAQQEEEPAPLWGAGGGSACCELDEALSAELLQLLGPDSVASTAPEPPQPHRSPPGQAEGQPVGRGAKRKRAGGEQQSEQRLRQLSAHNERLRAEVGRLSAEVQRARAALIERVLSLRRA